MYFFILGVKGLNQFPQSRKSSKFVPSSRVISIRKKDERPGKTKPQVFLSVKFTVTVRQVYQPFAAKWEFSVEYMTSLRKSNVHAADL